LRHKKTIGQVLEAIAVSLTMTHGRVRTLFLQFKLNYGPYESCLEDKNSTPELFTGLGTLLDAEPGWDLFALQK
jgi:hypothetical protein